jgi:hypothetical protein
MVDAAGLERIPGVDEVRQLTPRQLTVVARDAASATPAVVSAVEAAGVSVTSIHAARPSFDEVFVRLVERANGIPDGAADDRTPAGDDPRGDDLSNAGMAPDATAPDATAPPPGLPPMPEATDPAGQPVEVA